MVAVVLHVDGQVPREGAFESEGQLFNWCQGRGVGLGEGDWLCGGMEAVLEGFGLLGGADESFGIGSGETTLETAELLTEEHGGDY